jgi:hypothetical protein
MFKLINKLKIKYCLFALVVISLLVTNKVYAASLSLSPSTATVSIGNIISVRVLVNTVNKAINNSEAVIQFPSDLLEVVSISKSSSIFSLWVEEPSFSNLNGKIIFNGGVPNPGFNGQSGYIASITFRAKKQGTASLIFTDSAVRENDGLGTDILTLKNGAIIQIGIPKKIEIEEVPVTPTVTVKSTLPLKPIVYSETNPNQDVWYSSDTASFNWKIPSGVTSIKTLIDKVSNSNPTISYDSSVSQKTINNLNGGTYYFHIRYINSAGSGPITHYKVKIDPTSPLSFIPTIRNEDNKNIIKLNAEDSISGIDYYTLKIDENPLLKVNVSELIDSEYSLPIQSEGSHNLIVSAYDKANNHTEANLTFVSSSIVAPDIFLNNEEITKGDTVIIYGKTQYPNKEVEISFQFNNDTSISAMVGIDKPKNIKIYKQTTDSSGNFSIITDPINTNGTVNIWAEVLLSDSIKSQPSKVSYLKVKDTKIVSATLSLVYPIMIIIIILLVIVIFTLLFYFGWNKFLGQKVKIERELENTINDVHKAMLLFKEELNNQLDSLEKIKEDRILNKKEEVIFDEIKKNIDDIDNFIKKKLKKII